MRDRIVHYLITAKLVYVIIGFILGAVVADRITTRIYEDRLVTIAHDARDFGCLILSYVERPEVCPECGYRFHYLYSYTQEDLEKLIDEYLGELSFYQ